VNIFFETLTEFLKTFIVAYSVYNVITFLLMRSYKIECEHFDSLIFRFIGSFIFLVGISFDNSDHLASSNIYFLIEMVGISFISLGELLRVFKKKITQN